MQIILKYIVKTSMEKKFRTLLIILAIAVSGGLFYAALSMKENLEKSYIKSFTQTEGKADLRIVTNENSPEWYIPNAVIQKCRKQCEYIINKLEYTVEYKSDKDHYEPVKAIGMNLEDYKQVYDLTLVESLDGEAFVGNKIIISQETAEHYGVALGEEMRIKMNNKQRDYKIVGIAAMEGVFFNDKVQRVFLMPYDKFSDYLDTKSFPSTIYIKAKEGVDLGLLKTEIQDLYPKYLVEEPFTQADLDEKTSMISMSLLFMSIMLSFMSVFIIYSSFKVIMFQKLPVLGTFRSVGADKKKINQVMFLESCFYGLLGSLLGCLLGIVLEYILASVTMPEQLKAIGVKTEVSPSMTYLMASFLIANGICFMSTYSPIHQISNLPIKNIVLGMDLEKEEKKAGSAVVGLILVIISAVIPFYMSTSQLMALIGICITMPSISMGTGRLLPWVSEKLAMLLKPVLTMLCGNVGSIACMNMKKDKTLLTSASLIRIGLTVLILIHSLTINLTDKLINDIADLQNYDAYIKFNNMSDVHLLQIEAYKEVEDALGYSSIYNVPVTGMATKVTEIDGVPDENFFDFQNLELSEEEMTLADKLQSGRNVIITKTMQKRNNYEIGDQIQIDFSEYEGKPRTYTIIGSIDTIMQAGSYMLVAEKYLQMDINNPYYSYIDIRLKDEAQTDAFISKLKKDFRKYSPHVDTGEAYREAMRSTMQEITSLLTGFAIIALFVGGIGIINNFMIGFIERKRGLAIYRSIGMSKMQVVKMLIIEAGLVGLSGGLVGVLGGALSFNVSPLFMAMANVDMKMDPCINIYMIYLIGAILVACVASASPAKSAFKMKIIEGIKYE